MTPDAAPKASQCLIYIYIYIYDTQSLVVNNHIEVMRFRVRIVTFIQEDNFLAFLDLKDAYFQNPIH